jgi:hypothetical protein
MRSFDAAITAQLEAGELRPFALLDLDIDGTNYRYTDCDTAIVTGGNRFDPRGFRADPIRYGMSRIIDQARFEIDNLDDILTSVFVGGTPQDSEVILKLALLNSSYAVISPGPVTLFQGQVDAWALDEEKVTVTVTSELARWNQRTLSKHSASCRWKAFKGTECTYAGGETWCDRTYARCAQLANTNNFGGFRWLPSIVDSEIWWGRQRAV